MLRDGTGFKRTIVCCGRVDLRRGIDGLSTSLHTYALTMALIPLKKELFFFSVADVRTGSRAWSSKGTEPVFFINV